jgi:hypothetical protein
MQIQRLGVNSFVQTIRGSFVQQIEPAKDAMRVEEVDKLVLSSLTHELTTAMLTLRSFLNGSKANWTSTESGLTICASTRE